MKLRFLLTFVATGFGLLLKIPTIYAQELNPNRLAVCPKADLSKLTEVGPGGRTENWHNCWGRHEYKVHPQDKNGTLEGEWRNGMLNGFGVWTHRTGKYIGSFSGGQFHGQGTFITSEGLRYEGQWKNNTMDGMGIATTADGQRFEGIWENGNFVRQAKVVSPVAADNGRKKQKPDVSAMFEAFGALAGTNDEDKKEFNKFTKLLGALSDSSLSSSVEEPDERRRSSVDRERQQLADERRRFEDEDRDRKRQAAQERQRLEEEKRQLELARTQVEGQRNRPTVASDNRRRVALVIGNARYTNSPLKNPINDAEVISKALSASGFKVSRHDNLNYKKMRDVVRSFGEGIDKGDVALFYFAGHAIQYQGKNYLLPVDEDLKHENEIPASALDIDFVLAKMENAKNDLNIVVLDACRNNPLGSASRSIDRGLTTVNAAKGSFIAFATSPNKVALDGSGTNSPYTKHLADAIRKGGLTLEQVFKEVRNNVIRETNNQQVPWENSSILGEFYFK